MGDVKLIAADLDGTMMRKECYLSDYSKDVIRRLVAEGHIFVPTTGRCFASAYQKVKDIPGIRYYITSNGCIVYDIKEDKMLYEHFLPSELAYEIYMDTIALDGAPEIYSGLDSYLEEERFPLALKAFNKELSEDLYATTISIQEAGEEIRSGRMKVNKFNLVFHTEEDKRKIATKYEGREEIVVTVPTPYNLEVFYNGCDKDTGMQLIARKEGIAHSQTIAIGDSINDMKMVEYAALGLAVGNAMEPLKEVADQIILANHEDGPAKYIEEKILSEIEF